MSQLVKLKLPPGLARPGTLYETAGRWYASNFVRWNQGNMQPIGGWAARIATPMTGKPRAMHTWRDNNSTRYIAVGTEQKLYAATPSLTAMVDITPAGFTTGRASATAAAGYGSGLYGVGTYGTARTDSVSIQDASMWTLDNFGQYLVGCMSDDGKAYEWHLDTGTPTPAAAISGAPTGNSALFVTPENFVVLLGAGGDPRKVQWCDQGDDTTWTPTSINQAGDVNIQSQSRLMCGISTRSISLIFTELDVYVMQYVGLPYVYTVDRQAENAGIISRGAVVTRDSRAWWMGNANFFMWDGGSAQVIPCEIYSAVFENMNATQRSKIIAGDNPKFNEIWWAYPSSASTENDTIVVYNHLENTWAMHALERTAITHRNVFANPIMASSTDGLLYDHETGTTWDGTQPYATSGPYELGNGDRLMRVNTLAFDEGTQGDVTVTVYGSNFPQQSETTYGPYSSPNLVDCRIAARKLRMMVTFQSGSGRWGTLRADTQPGAYRY
jgi:hypothetical protein